MSSTQALHSMITQTLDMLPSSQGASRTFKVDDISLQELLHECQAQCTLIDQAEREPLRTIHHFACSGGTLFSKCIEAQPNTVLLSEIDPFSTLAGVANFAPYDILKQAQIGVRPLEIDAVEAIFLSGLTSMYDTLLQYGQRLVLRDHTHSHFCTAVALSSRPTIKTVLEKRFSLKSLVTVRHPLDSFLSLQKAGWIAFNPDTLEEYCSRYIQFIDLYEDTPVLRYEDFISEPAYYAEHICKILELPYHESWPDFLQLINMTGESGRKSDEIGIRPRRSVSQTLADESLESNAYAVLCNRLGYNSDTSALPIKGPIDTH